MPTVTGDNNFNSLAGTGNDDVIYALGSFDDLYGNGGQDTFTVATATTGSMQEMVLIRFSVETIVATDATPRTA